MSKKPKRLIYANFILWTARITGLVFIVLFFVFYVFSNLYIQWEVFNIFHLLTLLFIPSLYLFGLVISFKHDLLSGIVIILSILGFNAAHLIANQGQSVYIEFTYLIIPGVLLLLSAFFVNKKRLDQEEYESLQIELHRLKQNYKITMNMMEIVPEMLANDDLDIMLQKILNKAIEIIPHAQSGSILIRHGEVMKFHAAVGYDLEKLKKVELKIQELFQYKLGDLYAPTIVRDIKTFNEKHIRPEVTKDFDEQNALTAKAVLTCAITLHNKIYGFINLDNIDDYDAFSEQDKTYIKHLATQIDLALNNHLLVEDIYKLSRFDTLTGANTRKYNSELLNNLKKDSNLDEKPFSICVLDINNLKTINDRYGHHAGDDYLVHFSDLIHDYKKRNTIFSRTGGDEFIISFPNCDFAMANDHMVAIKRLMHEKPFMIEKEVMTITFGYGIASYPKDAEDISSLVQLADQRMYKDKNQQKLKTSN